MQAVSLYHRLWERIFPAKWVLGLSLVLLFGIVFAAGDWKLLPGPALLWVCAMFFTCMVFNRVRQESGSIFGAILTHAGFNFGMGFLIFYAL